ncbi:hypothetical protein D6827_00005 [Candidatus Parcubacteria bacterium]|nr:MAG: hypothetical protein D6827_00005 [Candidatus Parcubacteria bacterium]
MLNARRLKILAQVVEKYVETAQPVASATINIGVSPATVRNDMAALERAGYLRQPHTSAGRVPTELGYRLYLQNFVRFDSSGRPSSQMRNVINNAQTPRELVREMAKCLTRLSGETALASLDTGWSHHTGISNLFQKPEFGDVQTLRTISNIVDKFDDILRDMFGVVDEDVNIWIGGENPFGEQMATLMVKYHLPNGMTGTLGLIGPLRMNYEKNIKLLGHAKKLLDSEI